LPFADEAYEVVTLKLSVKNLTEEVKVGHESSL